MTKVTGELISIDDSAYDGFKGMTIYGNTRQNLWVNPSRTQRGVTVTSNADGSFSVSGTADAAATNSVVVNVSSYVLKPSTQYTFSCDKPIAFDTKYGFIVDEVASDDSVIVGHYLSLDGATTKVTFTTDKNMAYARFGVSVAASATASGTYRVMLNEGSEAQPWCPPGLNGVEELSIVTAGKNLTDQPDILDGHVNSYYQDRRVGDYLMRAGESLVLSFDLKTSQTGIQCEVGSYYGSVATYARNIKTVDAGNGRNSIAFTVPDWSDNKLLFARYARVKVPNVSFDYTATDIQLERGTEATAYEPPQITTTPIDLDGHTLNSLPDGTCDELTIDATGNVVLEKRVGSVTLSSDAGDWEKDGAGSRYFMRISPEAHDPYTPGSVVSDALPYRGQWDNSYTGTHIMAVAGVTYVSVGTDETAQDIVNVCGSKKLLYTLATPQTIDLGKISLPKLRKKPLVNSIWANGTASVPGFSLTPEIDYEYNQWSTYCDGFRTHGKHSYFDMGCCIAARDTGTPEKKSVTATVPYMSGFYDLSKLYGAIAFEARQLMYRFEFVEDSRDELQQRKSQFLEWLSQVHDEEIADDDIPGRHFIGSLSEWEFEEGEEGQSGSLEVTFSCQPFLEADEDTTKTCNAGSNTVTVNGQAVNVYAKTSSGTASIRIGGVTQSVGTTEIRLSVQLQPGDNAVTVTGSPVVLRWRELTV